MLWVGWVCERKMMADRELSSSNTIAIYIYVIIRTWFSRTTGTFPFWCHHFYEGALSNQSYAPWVPHPSLFCASSLIVVLFSLSQIPTLDFGACFEWRKVLKYRNFAYFVLGFLKKRSISYLIMYLSPALLLWISSASKVLSAGTSTYLRAVGGSVRIGSHG